MPNQTPSERGRASYSNPHRIEHTPRHRHRAEPGVSLNYVVHQYYSLPFKGHLATDARKFSSGFRETQGHNGFLGSIIDLATAPMYFSHVRTMGRR